MYNIRLTQQQLQIVMNSLVQLPYAAVAATIADIERQIREAEKKQGEHVDENG